MWAFALVVFAFFVAFAFFGVWMIALPLAVIGVAIFAWLQFRQRTGEQGAVNRLRDEAQEVGSESKGVEFTDRDRQTLAN